MGSMCVSSCKCFMFVSVVHPVAILSAVLCVIVEAPNVIVYNWWSCHSGFGKLLCKLYRYLPPQQWGTDLHRGGRNADPLNG